LRRRTIITCVLVIFFLASAFFPGKGFAQPSQGDWVVTGTQVVQNESITLNGNLTVINGGNLTLSNVVLTVNSQFPGQFGILVQPGGSFYVYSSKITASNTQDGFSFVAMGSHFVMKNSEVHGTGWCTGDIASCAGDFGPNGPGYHYGLLVQTDGADIEGNLFSDNGVAAKLTGSHILFERNTVISNKLLGILLLKGSGETITGNFLNQTATFSTWDIYVGDSNGNTIANNTLTTQTQVVGGNEIGGFGIWLDHSWNNTIMANYIFAVDTVLGYFSSNTDVEYNTITFRESGLFFQSSTNNRFIGNNIIGVPQATGGTAIFLSATHNSTIASNIVSGSVVALQVDSTSHSFVLNNNISTSFMPWSIYLFGSQHNVLSGNRVSPTSGEVILYYSSNGNIVTNNQISSDNPSFADRTILVNQSSSNTIFRNNFIGGRLGAYDNGNNSWSYRGRGNYWSLDQSADTDNDGIIDTPYPVPPNGIDRCPLAQPISIAKIPIPIVEPAHLTIVPNPPFTNTTVLNVKTTIPSGSAYVTSSLVIERSTLTAGTSADFTIRAARGGSVVIRDSTIYWQQGNLFVDKGGNLTILNSTIIAGQRGTFGLWPDGSEVIRGSTLSATPTGFGWVIWQQDLNSNANLTMRNSRFLSYGVTRWPSGPVTIGGNSDIENNLFSGCLTALNIAYMKESKIINNTFTGDPAALLIYETDLYTASHNYTSNIVASGDRFYSGSVSIISGSITFSNNVLNFGGGGLYGNQIVVTNNDFYSNIPVQGRTVKVSGNYWNLYVGKDSDLDGIGDTPYVNGQITDPQPYLRPSGWLTKFYLILSTNLPSSSPFSINGSSFSLGKGGTTTLRLGYVASYSISLPQTVALANGSSMVFSRWVDGMGSPARTIALSANASLGATYDVVTLITTTVTSISTVTTSSISTATKTVTTTLPPITTTSTITVTVASTPSGGGIPEFPYQLFAISVFAFFLVVGYLLVRRRRPPV
jgi:parallel beta-helix repeat protein